MPTKRKIKLLIITPTLQCGGSEKFVSLLCNHINTDKFRVCLVVVNNERPFYTITNTAIEVINLKKNRVLFSLPAIKKVVRQSNPDVIFSTANHLNIYLAFFKNLFSDKIIFVGREASIVSINSMNAKMPHLYNWLIKKYYSRFDLLICQSAYMQHDLVKHYNISANKTLVIHNATNSVSQLSIRSGKPVSDTGYKFITVARLSAEKGIERLIHTVGLLSIPFTYYIIGEGAKRGQLQDLINSLQLQDKVFLTGEQMNPFANMEDADLFLCGSYYEGFPNALLEAGAHGIPVVAFEVPGGIPEIITNQVNGLLVEDNDIIAFAVAIKKALDSNFNRNEIIAHTQKRFSVSKMMADVEQVLLTYAPLSG